jgi:hypothetical protein
MERQALSLKSSPDTFSAERLQVFECQSIPVPPGTKAQRRRKRQHFRHWGIVIACVVFSGLIGFFVGWLIFA